MNWCRVCSTNSSIDFEGHVWCVFSFSHTRIAALGSQSGSGNRLRPWFMGRFSRPRGQWSKNAASPWHPVCFTYIPIWWLSKGNPLISGKAGLMRYYNLARYMKYRSIHCFLSCGFLSYFCILSKISTTSPTGCMERTPKKPEYIIAWLQLRGPLIRSHSIFDGTMKVSELKWSYGKNTKDIMKYH